MKSKRICSGATPRLLGAVLLVGALAGCGRANTDGMTTGRTVRQAKFPAAKGLGDYRTVEMPEAARKNIVVANPNAPGVVAYNESLLDR